MPTTDYKALAGRFIVIDGPDGAGKGTQLAMLAEHLRAGGADVQVARDPGGTAIGDKVRAILLDGRNLEMSVTSEMLLYMASRAQLVAEVIAPALRQGRCVLCDRYVSSTLAYQGAAGADVEAILEVAQVAVGGYWPDLTMILDLPAEVGLSRLDRAKDRLEQRPTEYHARVRQSFLDQARRAGDRFAVVDASGPPDKVQEDLRAALERWLTATGRRRTP